jgi:hypothetical protein
MTTGVATAMAEAVAVTAESSTVAPTTGSAGGAAISGAAVATGGSSALTDDRNEGASSATLSIAAAGSVGGPVAGGLKTGAVALESDGAVTSVGLATGAGITGPIRNASVHSAASRDRSAHFPGLVFNEAGASNGGDRHSPKERTGGAMLDVDCGRAGRDCPLASPAGSPRVGTV